MTKREQTIQVLEAINKKLEEFFDSELKTEMLCNKIGISKGMIATNIQYIGEGRVNREPYHEFENNVRQDDTKTVLCLRITLDAEHLI